MIVQQRMEVAEKLGNYILAADEQWIAAKDRAARENPWFAPEFIELSLKNIADNYLQPAALSTVVSRYGITDSQKNTKEIGIIMAGNIPLVGFHDLLCVFLSGHTSVVKLSSKDAILLPHLVEKMKEWNPAIGDSIRFADRLNNCDAYIATGSSNSSLYFEQYFGKYPHIIRRNRTSVAILDGTETKEELEMIADDVYQYFGLGCRNVTKIFVPEGYDFVPILDAFRKYDWLADHNKYKNNYDYQLAVLIINKKFYMTNGSIVLYEDPSVFSPISQLNYGFYKEKAALVAELEQNSDIQCITGKGFIPFGSAQCPSITDFADGVDTLKFLLEL